MGSITSGLSGIASGLTPQNSYNANTDQVQSQQQQLATALLAQSQGQGPNPSQSQYLQNNNQAIQQNTGMIASQKGISPAQAARAASQNAGTQQQQAAAQAATQQGQQQLQAQQQLAGVYGTIGQEQLGVSGINSGVSAQNAAGDQKTEGGLLGGINPQPLNSSSYAHGGTVGYADGGDIAAAPDGAAQPSMPQGSPGGGSTGDSASAQIANQILAKAGVIVYQPGNADSFKGKGPNLNQANKYYQQLQNYLNSAGSGTGGDAELKSAFGQSGGTDTIQAPNAAMQNAAANVTAQGDVGAGGGGDVSAGGAADAAGGAGVDAGVDAAAAGAGADAAGGATVAGLAAGDAAAAEAAPLLMLAFKGGSIPDHLHEVASIYHPHMISKGPPALKSQGGPVPGQAKIRGDSPKNDTVNTMLSPGEVVIPRSIMESKDPAKGAAQFVAEQLRKHGKGQAKASPEEFKSALKSAIGSRKKAA